MVSEADGYVTTDAASPDATSVGRAPLEAGAPEGALAVAPGPPAPPAPASTKPLSGPFYKMESSGKPAEILRADAPNARYAALGSAACMAELHRRRIPIESV